MREGTIVGQELTKWPDQLDFSVELAKARGSKPDAIFAFYPGASGAQFLIQYLQSGLKDQIPLYTAFTIDEITLPRQKEAAVGIPGAQEWVNDLPNEQNKRFVADYRKKHPGLPPTFYGAQTYDAAMLINAAVVATKGDLSDKEAVRKAMEKADFESVRGKFRFGINHIPIQNFYLQEAIKDGDGYVLKTVATIVEDSQDRFPRSMPDEVERRERSPRLHSHSRIAQICRALLGAHSFCRRVIISSSVGCACAWRVSGAQPASRGFRKSPCCTSAARARASCRERKAYSPAPRIPLRPRNPRNTPNPPSPWRPE
jgi:hypothetical protein